MVLTNQQHATSAMASRVPPRHRKRCNIRQKSQRVHHKFGLGTRCGGFCSRSHTRPSKGYQAPVPGNTLRQQPYCQLDRPNGVQIDVSNGRTTATRFSISLIFMSHRRPPHYPRRRNREHHGRHCITPSQGIGVVCTRSITHVRQRILLII